MVVIAVRRESVRLELEDNFSRKMLTAAAATNALKDSLSDLDGTSIRSSRSINQVSKDTDSLSRSAVQGTAAIDRFSGRMGILLKLAGSLGPALVPIGAVGVAGVAALSSQFGFLALGMSSIVIAAQGVGDALSAVNKATLEPTAANLEAAREALRGLDPAAQAFVARFQEFRPILTEIRNSAAAGFFPGLTESLDSFERVAPKVGDIMQALGATGGNLISDAADALAGPEWGEFMDFIAREAPPAFEALGRSVGNVASGMADLWMAFDPLNDGMGDWLLNSSRGFAEWADGLSRTQGFQEFVAYVQENGPKVAEATTAIANAILQIAEAAAPLGGPVLDAITGIANAIATIADSPLGTPIMAAVTAMSALSLAANVATASVGRLNAALAASGTAGATKGAGLLAGIPAAAAVVGTVAGVNLVDNLVQVVSGDRSLTEATDAVMKWSNPVSAGLELVGINAFGTREPFLQAALAGMDFASSARGVSAASAAAADRVRDFSAALRANHEATLSAFDAETQYRQALRASRGVAARNEAGIRGNTAAALENRTALGQLAAAWNNQSEAVRNNVNRSSEARRAFIQTAESMGVPAEAARRLAARLLDIPQTVEPDVKVDTNGAEGIISRVNNALMGINGNTAHTYVITHLRTVREGGDTAGGPPAPNGTFSSGGYTGDIDPRAVAGRVHGREVVLPHDIVQRDRAMLLARYGHLPGMGMLASRGSERPAGSGQRLNINVTAGAFSGQLKTSAGVVDFEAPIRAIVRDEIDQSRNFEQSQR